LLGVLHDGEDPQLQGAAPAIKYVERIRRLREKAAVQAHLRCRTVTAHTRIRDPKVRRAVVALVEQIVAESDSTVR
jgi:hypothetical protein